MITGQFSESFPPLMDGVANVVKNYAFWLNIKYGKSYVITPKFPGYGDIHEFEVYRYFSVAIPKRAPYRMGIPQLDFQATRKIGAIPFDLVHAHCPFSSGILALKISKERHIPVVATFHSKYYDDFKDVVRSDALARFFVRRIVDFYNRVDFVWTVNRATVDTLREYGFKGNIEVVYNGTDFKPYRVKEADTGLVNHKLGLSDSGLVFLYVGQHIWQKNLKMLIQSLSLLKEWGVEFTMIFAGQGYALEEMKQLTICYGLEKRVRFLGLVLDRSFLEALYHRADLFLFPSVYDNAPLVVKEAAAAGCPSLLIEGSNACEGVTDGYNGFLCKNNPLDCARRIRQAISDRALLETVGRAARETLYRSWEDIVDEVYGRYLEIIHTYRRKYNII